jgi:hypothetical protein
LISYANTVDNIVSIMNRDLSPPPLKRQRLTHTSIEPERKQSGTGLRLFSWNINGISPFIQQPITSFFTSDKPLQPRSEASLRDFLQRHDFPDVLFLQEVKINPSKLPVSKPSRMRSSVTPRSLRLTLTTLRTSVCPVINTTPRHSVAKYMVFVALSVKTSPTSTWNACEP